MPSHPYDHDRYFPLYAVAEELRLPILFHTGYVAWLEVSDRRCHPSSDYMRPFRLDRIARATARRVPRWRAVEGAGFRGRRENGEKSRWRSGFSALFSDC